MKQKEIGIIGYGSMGKMLAQGFLRHGVAAEDMVITNRHAEKMAELQSTYPAVTATEDNRAAAACAHVFLCVEPMQMAGVLGEIKDTLTADTHLITIGGAGDMAAYSQAFDGAISRVIPTLLAEIDRGYALVSHNEKVDERNKSWLEKNLALMGKNVVLPEEQLKTFMQFTSCGPAFIAALFEQWLTAGEQVLPTEAKEVLFATLLETVSGTVSLMEKTRMSFAEMIARVATKGGITERGVQILESGLAPVFGELTTACNDRNDMAAGKVAASIAEIK